MALSVANRCPLACQQLRDNRTVSCQDRQKLIVSKVRDLLNTLLELVENGNASP